LTKVEGQPPPSNHEPATPVAWLGRREPRLVLVVAGSRIWCCRPGLAASGRRLVAAFAQGEAIGRQVPGARPVQGPSDIFFARINPDLTKRR